MEGGGEVEEAADVEEGGEVTLVAGLPRARAKLRGVITTGNEATTRRWRGQGPRLDNTTTHQHVEELQRQI